jgi:cytoskeleton protein RodZ
LAQQDESQDGAGDGAGDSAAEIRRQFALLQAEMQRVMAEPSATPPPPREAGEAIDCERIDHDPRRDAERQRAGMVETADGPAVGESIAALRARIEEIGRQADEGVARLNRTLQGNREAIAAVSLRIDALTRQLPSRWLTPLAILIGAVVIAAAVVASAPGSLDMLLDRLGVPIDQPKRHAEAAEPAVPPSPAPALAVAATEPPAPMPAPALAASPPPVPPPSPEPPPVQPVPLPVAIVASPPPAAAAAQPPAPESEPVPTSAPPAATPAAPPTAPPTAPPGQIVLLAKADTWVAVKNRQGAELLGRLLHAGESWTVPAQTSLTLTTGNAGGLELLVDGTPAPSLGAVGAVRRDVPLDPLLVRAGRYAVDASTTPKPATVSR